MIEYCCACPTLWLDRSDKTQFMIGSWGCKVIWAPMVKLSVSAKAQQQAKSYFSKGNCVSVYYGRALLQNLELWFIKGALRRSQTKLLSATDTSGSMASSESYGPSGREAGTVAWTCQRAFCCSGPISDWIFVSPSKNSCVEILPHNMLMPAAYKLPYLCYFIIASWVDRDPFLKSNFLGYLVNGPE